MKNLEMNDNFLNVKSEYLAKKEKPVIWKTEYPYNCYIWRESEVSYNEKEALL